MPCLKKGKDCALKMTGSTIFYGKNTLRNPDKAGGWRCVRVIKSVNPSKLSVIQNTRVKSIKDNNKYM